MRPLFFVRGQKWSAIFRPHFTDEAELMDARIAVEGVTGVAPKVRAEWAQFNFEMDGRAGLGLGTLELRAVAH